LVPSERRARTKDNSLEQVVHVDTPRQPKVKRRKTESTVEDISAQEEGSLSDEALILQVYNEIAQARNAS